MCPSMDSLLLRTLIHFPTRIEDYRMRSQEDIMERGNAVEGIAPDALNVLIASTDAGRLGSNATTVLSPDSTEPVERGAHIHYQILRVLMNTQIV